MTPTTLLRCLTSATVVSATLLAFAPPAVAAPTPAWVRSDGDVRQQVQRAADSARGVRQKATPPGRATPATAAMDAGLRAMVISGAIGVTARVQSPTMGWSGSAGLRDKDGRAPAGRQDRFRAASQTKMMVATLVLQEVERGTWRLDQRVDEVIPGLFPGHPDVTFRGLLSHTSGAPNGTYELLAANVDDLSSTDQVMAALSRDYTDADHIDVINAVPWTTPGEYLYSNAGYVALGMLLKAQNGRSVGSLLAERVWRPAKMNHTSYPDEPGLRGPVLHEDGWSGAQVGWTELDGFDPDFFRSSGAVVSTTADLSAFVQALMSGRLVDRSLVQQMLGAADQNATQYGLGIYRIPDPCAAPGTAWLYGHDGGTLGTLSITLTSPDGGRRVSLGATGRDLSAIPGRWTLDQALVPMLLATC